MKSTYRKYLPYAAAIVLFGILTLIYFRPLLAGKELRQDDISRHKAASKEIADHREKYGEEPLWTNSMFGGMPAYQISAKYPGNWLGTIDPVFKLGLPHPGGYMFLYFAGFFILLLCLGVQPWLALTGALAYGLSSYFLIIIEAGHNSKANALGYLPALIGGVVLLFRGKYWLGFAVTALFTGMELNANHVQITYYGYMLIAFIIAGYFFTLYRDKQVRMFFMALALFLGATLLGLLPNAGSLLVTAEYTKHSTRGKSELTIKSTLKAKNIGLDGQGQSLESDAAGHLKEQYERNTTTGLDQDYATQWSYGIGETFTFLIPDFKGGASSRIQSAGPDALKKVNPNYREMVAGSNAYFGDQPFTSGPVYIGAIVVFLALLGLFVVKHPLKWPLAIATALTIALGWGSNFMPLTDFFMHYVPGYNKFRAVSMIMVVAELTLPLLAVLCLSELIRVKSWDEKIRLRLIRKEVRLRRLIFGCAAAVAGFCLLGYLAPELVNDFTASNEEAELVRQYVAAGYPEDEVKSNIADLMPQIGIARKAIFRSDAFRSFVFVVLGFLALYLYFTGKIRKELFFAAMGLFIVIDLWTVDARYLNERSFVPKNQSLQDMVQKTPADEEILQDTTPGFRVLNLDQSFWNEASTSYYHRSVGGYHGAKLKKIDELKDFHLNREIEKFYREANRALGSDSARKSLLRGLGVINMLNTRYFILPAGEQSGEMALLNTEANGSAWFVSDLVSVPDADEEILGLGKIDTRTQAVVREGFVKELSLKQKYSGNGTVRLVSYKANNLVYEAASDNEGFIVFSEIYYPAGWNAYVDGKPRMHIGVNYVLRGMPIEAGKHRIEFRFEPRTYKVGNTISLAGSILLIIGVGIGIYMHRRNNVIVS
jgi:hypothetical protein